MHNTRNALAALAALVALTAPSPAGDDAAANHRAGLQFVGYRILVAPEVIEAKRPRAGLVTRSIAWKLRSVYADGAGHEVFVRPVVGRKHATDYVVRLNRPWQPTDIARQSPDYADLRQAMRRFKTFKRATDLDLLEVQIGVVLRPSLGGPGVAVRASVDGHHVAIGHGRAGHTVVVHHHDGVHVRGDDPIKHVRGDDPIKPVILTPPSCREVLLAHGHHPQHLDECQGVEPHCAAALLAAGHHPQHLDGCKRHLSPTCTTTLLARGHHPHHLDSCAGVEDSCAVTLLEQGRHPNQLDNCRR